MKSWAHSTARRLLAAAASIGTIALIAAPLGAQTHRSAIGVTGGWSTSGDLTPGLWHETTLEDGWIGGAQLEVWPGSRRLGLRLNGTVASREMVGSPRRFLVASADLGLALRLLAADRDRSVAPFIGLGAGPVGYFARDDGLPLGDGAYGDDPVIRFAVTPSAGVDLFTRSTVGIRLEIADQIVLPSIGESPPSEGLPRVHNPTARAAVQLRLGRATPRPVVATAPRPATDVRVEIAPAAEPAPVEPPAPEPTPVEPPAPVAAAAPAAAPERAPAREPLGRPVDLPGDPAPRPVPARVAADPVAPLPPATPRPTPAPAREPLGRPVDTPARPAPAAAPAMPARVAPAPPATSVLYTVQVGAFAQRAMAQNWVSRLDGVEIPILVTEADVRGSRLIRVRVGAVESMAEARLLAERLRRDYGYDTWITTVSVGESVPADAIVATLRFLFEGR
jgi:septal ring-binding cell division protein DamX